MRAKLLDRRWRLGRQDAEELRRTPVVKPVESQLESVSWKVRARESRAQRYRRPRATSASPGSRRCGTEPRKASVRCRLAAGTGRSTQLGLTLGVPAPPCGSPAPSPHPARAQRKAGGWVPGGAASVAGGSSPATPRPQQPQCEPQHVIHGLAEHLVAKQALVRKGRFAARVTEEPEPEAAPACADSSASRLLSPGSANGRSCRPPPIRHEDCGSQPKARYFLKNASVRFQVFLRFPGLLIT